MAKMLYSVTWSDGPPTLGGIRAKYGFAEDEVDEPFGVVAVDPDANLYSVMVEEAAVWRFLADAGAEAKTIEGPFANPRIEPFDLQESPDD